MRALFLLMAVLLSGCILRAEDARTNPFGEAEATSEATNEDMRRDRMMRSFPTPASDPNRGCGGCS